MDFEPIDFTDAKPEDFTVVDPDNPAPQQTGDETPPANPPAPAPAPAAAPQSQAQPPAEPSAPAAAAPAATPATAPAAPVVADWKETLKSQGFNDDFIKLAEFAKTKGSLSEYLAVKSANYKDMDPLALVRADFDERYPTLSAEEKEILWETEVVEKYNLDRDRFPETDTAAKAGLIKLRLEADKIRQKKIEYQESFGAPSYEDPGITEANQAVESIKSSAELAALMQSKTLAFDVDGKPIFNLRVENPDELGSMFIDPVQFDQSAFDENGKPRVQRMLMAAAVLKDPLVIKRIFEAGVSAGRNNQYEITEDAKPFDQSAGPSAPEESMFDAFKNRGRLVENEG